MTNQKEIPKNADLPEAMDYRFLRKSGQAYIEKLAHKIWTDYNIHDPGISILELLCYTITDIGYRISHPIADLLTSESKEEYPAESTDEIPTEFITARKSGSPFFTAQEILTSSPITKNDYRKLLIDIDGVLNADLVEVTTTYYVDTLNKRLRHNAEDCDAGNTTVPSIQVRGQYNVIVDIDETLSSSDKNSIENTIKEKLHANRNLCEVFLETKFVNVQNFILCAEIDISADADANLVEANIFHTLQNYLTPSVHFYSLEEMYNKGKTADEIFNGPRLKSGFIDDEEFEKTTFRTTIHLSDVILEIMKIPGVKAIRDIVITQEPNEGDQPVIKEKDERWTIPIMSGCKPRLIRETSRIVYYKDIYPLQADYDTVTEKIIQLKESETKSILPFEDNEIPKGVYRNTEIYPTFQNHFPVTYGVASAGLPDSADETRKAQAKQLKAYLLFFDQILANYFSQLENVRHLYSLDDSIKQTFFVQCVTDVKDCEEIYSPEKKNSDGSFEYEDLKEEIHELVEPDETFLKRRNSFIDHLLARFAEKFSEYVWILYNLKSGSNDTDFDENKLMQGVIDTKLRFLNNYPELSFERARAINFSDPDKLEDQDNVAGLHRRTAYLLGVENYNSAFQSSALDKDFESYFLIEHILLKPFNDDDDYFLPIIPDSDYPGCENLDPYSFRITFVMPAWSSRFADTNFRRFCDKTLRQETPSHILPRICWVNKEQMNTFKSKYEDWLEAKNTHDDEETKLYDFLEILKILRNVYPSATLSIDCDEEGEPPFIISQTSLGTKEV